METQPSETNKKNHNNNKTNKALEDKIISDRPNC